MPSWLGIIEILLAVAICIAAILTLLAGRRRWLARLGGAFECSLRLRTKTPGSGWVLGLARYNDEILEWFRFFSFALRPRKTFERQHLRVLDYRQPDPVEAVSLYADQRVVRIEVGEPPDTEEWDLAMSPGSLTGLLSWLEAAPPGLIRY
jgi:Protein of unknown function (DUF2550)